MSTLTQKRKAIYEYRLTNHHNITESVDEIEPKLDQIILNTDHSVIYSSYSNTILSGVTVNTPTIDIGAISGIFTAQLAGSAGHANLVFILEVSIDSNLWYEYPIAVLHLNGSISSQWTQTFRYSRVKITNPLGNDYAVDIIVASRH